LQPSLPRDLETVCLKCLQKEPARRYPSAAALADDLGRFLKGEPVHARPIGPWERGVKWARRRPTAAALMAVSVLAILATVLGSVVYAAYANQQLKEKDRLANVRDRFAKAVARGEAALTTGEWQSAKDELSNALALIGTEAELAGFHEETQRLLAEAERRLAEQRARAEEQQARDRASGRQQEFNRLRDVALFHASDFTGSDLPGHREAARKTAWQALELVAARTSHERNEAAEQRPDPGAWSLDPGLLDSFNDVEQADLVARCYELLLIWAEAEAQPLASEDRQVQADRALRILDRAAQLRAPTRAYHLRRASYLAQKGDAQRAQQERARAEALRPQDAVDIFLLGQEAYQRKELLRAVDHLRDTLQRQPEHFWAQMLLAVSYLGLGEYDKAESYLTLCQGRQPRLVWVYLLRGFTFGNLGDNRARAAQRQADAEIHFNKADDDFRTAQELLVQDPNEEASYVLAVNRGIVRFLRGRSDEAIEEFRSALALKPNLTPAYVNLVEAYQKQKKWDDAAAWLERAIQLKPNQADLYHRRAELARARTDEFRDLPAALRDFDNAIRLFGPGPHSPKDSEVLSAVYVGKGQLLYLEGRLDEALAALDAALQYRPIFPLVQRLRGAVLLKQRYYQKAEEAFDAHLRTTNVPTAEVYEARGMARAKRKDYAGAIADYSRALDLEPESSALRAYRGWTYLVVEEVPRLALRDFEDALERDPHNANAWAGLGSAHVKLGIYQSVEKSAREALRQGPETAELVYKVARIYAQMAARGEARDRRSYEDKARLLLERALRLESDEQTRALLREGFQKDPAWNAIRRK
jgi:tetratricopeptide (TPR) repeat protein